MSRDENGWAATWTASPQMPGAGFEPNWSEAGFADQTVRQTVRLSIGGDALRIRLSNRYGTTPLRVAGLSVALPVGMGGAGVKPETVHAVTVGGDSGFVIPAGGDVSTDGVALGTEAFDAVTVTMYLAEPSGPATCHAQALATSHRASGDRRADDDGATFTETSGSWYFLSGIHVADEREGATDYDHGLDHDHDHDHDIDIDHGIVVLGDSLTDGTGGTPDTDQRFTNLLARRLAAAGRPRAVLNQGIGGNRVTIDSAWLGERAPVRLGLDVLPQPGVGTVVILAGINDIGISELAGDSPFPVLKPYTEVTAEEVITGYRDMIRRAHAAGLRAVGATLLPIRGSAYSTPRSEAERETINAWIRESREYDAVIDLARAMGDTLDPAHDSGDHLHLSDAGYRAMAAAVDLSLL
ncbi:SGNH/GDSL hydrolase family protein [Catenulispora sp. NL8]|uniref:SGNH/GDSL hydrolase family protein n=1 Tax=Catenulispora pinistramenti TaxID=2705254 RepID=A0ABS5L696_9ACTN|nr:SGNH/GDSL hydrolase family protein [Catenulispora pinistramenti]MBS2553765.1 SGNH/GDSL hydrolase family protein [Catenulispora pinistramenti]